MAIAEVKMPTGWLPVQETLSEVREPTVESVNLVVHCLENIKV